MTGFWPLATGAGHQPLQHGQDEAGRLAGAGLGAGKEIAASQHGRNGLQLDGRGLGIAVLVDSTHEDLGEAEMMRMTFDFAFGTPLRIVAMCRLIDLLPLKGTSLRSDTAWGGSELTRSVGTGLQAACDGLYASPESGGR